MKTKKTFTSRLFAVILALVLACGITLPMESTVYAAGNEWNNVITNIEMQKRDGSTPLGTVEQWQVFRLYAEFELPDYQVKEGDTTTITLPDELRFNQTLEFDLETDNGDVVAHAVIDEDAKTITLTYTQFPQTHSEVRGSFYFYVQMDRNNVDEEETIPIYFDVSGRTVYGGDLHFAGIPEPNPYYIDKAGWQSSSDGKTFRFQISVNTIREELEDVSILDVLINPGFTIIPNSVRIYKGDWTIVHGEWVLDAEEDVTDDYTVELSNDNTSFSIDFGDMAEDDGFRVFYDARANYELVDGEIVKNEAKLIGHETVINTVSDEIIYSEAGGQAEGYVYGIQITKVGADNGANLEGAKFNVIRVATGATVGTIETDSNGEGYLGNLLKTEYKIVETEAPDGYELSTEEFEVSVDDFNSDKIAVLTIENEREKTEVKVSVGVTKTWIGPAASEVTVKLMNGTQEVASQVLNAGNNWQHTFTDLEKYDATGNEIEYAIAEVTVEGYDSVITGDMTDGFEITNTNTEKISIPVTKTWVGAPADAVTVILEADGSECARQELTAADGWAYTFTDLPKYDSTNGHEIEYTLAEISIPNYSTVITGSAATGFTVTNTITTTPPPTDVPNTGDTSNIVLYFVTMIMSAVSLVGVSVFGRRKRRQQYK